MRIKTFVTGFFPGPDQYKPKSYPRPSRFKRPYGQYFALTLMPVLLFALIGFTYGVMCLSEARDSHVKEMSERMSPLDELREDCKLHNSAVKYPESVVYLKPDGTQTRSWDSFVIGAAIDLELNGKKSPSVFDAYKFCSN